ncbi:pentapeptide repeat-containing protein [Mycolicibacterium sp. 120270]|nr:pentapeptide repeat-containing protein [Mycolicibacterium sp. 120270]MDX1886824.1 pentapeptide repeat-containing protein [Mycolicibacterium sp. 120270]
MKDPPWILRDVVVALVVGGVVAWGSVRAQQDIDDERMLRESSLAAQQERQSARLENLRFVRDRSSIDDSVVRPFGGLDLAHQNMIGLNLTGASFIESNLQLADLTQIDVSSSSKFGPANFYGADLCGANLTNSIMFFANFTHASLRATTLSGGWFGRAWFDGTDMSYSYGAGADFDHATFVNGVNFRNAVLTDASFWSADLSGADFSDAIVAGADFSHAIISSATKFDGVVYTSSTKWPQGFTPKSDPVSESDLSIGPDFQPDTQSCEESK